MNFDKIKEKVLSSSETSENENENIAGSELHEEFDINNFLPEFEPLKLSGKNLAQQYVSAFNTGMNVYQCLNYLQGYVYTLVTAMNETIEAWNTVVPLLEQATKEWTVEEFDYKWSILKPQVIELVTNLTIEIFNKSWEELKPQVIKLAQDTTDAEFKKQWDILKPQVIELVQNTTTDKFNSEWEKLKPTIIQLSTDTTIGQFNRSWTELKPQVIELAQTTTNTKFDEKWTELRPQLIELAQTTTSDKFDEKWDALQPTLTETVNNLAMTQTISTFNEEWTKLKPQIIELAQTTTSNNFDEKWNEIQPTLTETVNNLVNTNLDTFKSTLWDEVTRNKSFPFLVPENFGAVGDGTTDDHTAFNACFIEAMDTDKPILLNNKSYLISVILDVFSGTIIGLGSNRIIVNDNEFLNKTQDVKIKNVNFVNIKPSNNVTHLINDGKNTYFENCNFLNFTGIFGKLTQTTTSLQLLNNCILRDTSIYTIGDGVTTTENNIFTVNNTIITNINNRYYSFWNGKSGSKVYFNNCRFTSEFTKFNSAMITTPDDLIFSNCVFNVKNAGGLINVLGDSTDSCIYFNKCNIKAKSIVEIKNKYLCLNIKDSVINVDKILHSNYESSLWLENNIMDTKPIINSDTGKVNLVEIQQKYSDTSENIFPWTAEPTPTVENNVSLNKIGTDQYYILTESKDKNVKKLDYYFTYNFDYLPNTPYYTNNIIVRDLDVEGYTLKRSLLSNNICKLKNKSTGELIDYVYLMLDDNVTVTSSKNNQQFVYTTIAMKYLPYFAKLKTDTPIAGHLYVDACISIILEKTSS